MRVPIVLVGIALLSGCAARSTYRPPSSALEEGIFLREVDESNRRHPISGLAPFDSTIARTPIVVRVDENSAIEVVPRPRVIRGQPGALDSTEVEALGERVQRMRELLKLLAKLMEAHARALERYQVAYALEAPARWKSPEFALFVDARREFGGLDERLVKALDPLWPEDTPAGAAVDALLKVRATKPDGLQGFVQREIDSLEARTSALKTATLDRGATLRLEAFLESPGKDPTAIHLEGYDSIEQLTLERHDRFGVDLSPTERAALRDLTLASKELADAADRVRRGEQAVAGAFSGVSASAAKQLASVVTEAEGLRAELAPERLRQRRDRLRRSMAALRDSVREALSSEARGGWEQTAESAQRSVERLVATSPAFTEVSRVLDGIRGLTAPTRSPEDLVALVTGIAPTVRALDSGTARHLVLELTGVMDSVEGHLEKLPEAVRGIARVHWEASTARVEVQSLQSLGKHLAEFAHGLGEMTGLLRFAPNHVLLDVPEAFNVPLDSASPTVLEIGRTPRLLHDRVTLRASLIEEDSVTARVTYAFRVDRYGHWARLDPSVVVAIPTERGGADQPRRFAPAVSWLHSYRPRPEDRGLSPVLRVLDPSVGVHAAFLSFAADRDNQVGLGFTLGLWRGTVLGGLGWNVMAEARDQDRKYYFVGSSLIAWLHRFQRTEGSE